MRWLTHVAADSAPNRVITSLFPSGSGYTSYGYRLKVRYRSQHRRLPDGPHDMLVTHVRPAVPCCRLPLQHHPH
ncbi:MAG: hypothetical protein MZV63_38570 [Marinilabiliales bacterium]|nr:hypothetical protein [Marinilabiliales bacterium]